MNARKHAEPASEPRVKAAFAIPPGCCANDLQCEAVDTLNYIRRQFADLLWHANDASHETSDLGVEFDRDVVAQRAYEILVSLNHVEDYVARLHDKAELSERGAK